MDKLIVFILLVGAIAFVLGQVGQGGYGFNPQTYRPNGQYGYVSGYPLGEYLRAKNVYMQARLADGRKDSFLGDIVGLGSLFLLWAILTNRTGTYAG